MRNEEKIMRVYEVTIDDIVGLERVYQMREYENGKKEVFIRNVDENFYFFRLTDDLDEDEKNEGQWRAVQNFERTESEEGEELENYIGQEVYQMEGESDFFLLLDDFEIYTVKEIETGKEYNAIIENEEGETGFVCVSDQADIDKKIADGYDMFLRRADQVELGIGSEFLDAYEALEDNGFESINAIDEFGRKIMRRKSDQKDFAFVRMSHFNTLIYTVTIIETEIDRHL